MTPGSLASALLLIAGVLALWVGPDKLLFIARHWLAAALDRKPEPPRTALPLRALPAPSDFLGLRLEEPTLRPTRRRRLRRDLKVRIAVFVPLALAALFLSGPQRLRDMVWPQPIPRPAPKPVPQRTPRLAGREKPKPKPMVAETPAPKPAPRIASAPPKLTKPDESPLHAAREAEKRRAEAEAKASAFRQAEEERALQRRRERERAAAYRRQIARMNGAALSQQFWGQVDQLSRQSQYEEMLRQQQMQRMINGVSGRRY